MDKFQKYQNEKAASKRRLMGKMFFPRTPIVAIDISESKKPNFFHDLIEGLEILNIVAVVISKDADETRGNVRFVPPENRELALAASDLIIELNGDPAKAWRMGCVPITQSDDNETSDYNPLQEKGNGFYFKKATKWGIFAALIRALETYQFPYDWENLIREILKK